MSEPGAEDALKQLQLTPENKACANCSSVSAAGHGAVVMKANGESLGMFVCHNCKSAHQSFSHYCKSVSQSYWKMNEVAVIRDGGNQRARAQWMARCGANGLKPGGDSKGFVQACYNERRFHAAGGGGGGGGRASAPAPATTTYSTKAVQMEQRDRDAVFALSGNDVCVDCKTKAPQWASVTFGSLLCLECSGANRGLGVHISFVRSITMDSWSPKQARERDACARDARARAVLRAASSSSTRRFRASSLSFVSCVPRIAVFAAREPDLLLVPRPPSRAIPHATPPCAASPAQIAMMMQGGNAQLRAWHAKHGIDRMPIPQKYHEAAAQVRRAPL